MKDGGQKKHRRGEEANALAEIARKIREGTLPEITERRREPQAAAVVEPPPAPPRERSKKRKQDAEAGAEMTETPVTVSPAPAGAPQQGSASLRRAAAALHTAADDGTAGRQVEQLLANLAACAEQVGHALAAAGSAQLPAPLQLLQAQAAQATRPGTLAATAPSAYELAALALQAEAAAAALESQQTADNQDFTRNEQHGEQQQAEGFRAWYLTTFADCYAAELEALQDAEPPIPAGVLLQCVRAAADSNVLFPPHYRSLVLQGRS